MNLQIIQAKKLRKDDFIKCKNNYLNIYKNIKNNKAQSFTNNNTIKSENYKKLIENKDKNNYLEEINSKKFLDNILNKINLEYTYVFAKYKINELGGYFYFTDLLIGEGTFGKVYFGLIKANLETIAVKKINMRVNLEKFISKEEGKM